MSKSELRENILNRYVEAAIDWGLAHRTQVIAGVVALIMVVLASSVFIIRGKEANDVNWTRITQAQSLIAQDQPEQARTILEEVRAQAAGKDAGRYAAYYLGDLQLSQKKVDDAIATLTQVVDQSRGTPLHPLALTNLAFAYEQKKDYLAAAKTLQQFLDKYADHFLAARNQLALGRNYLLAGDAEAAKRSLGQLIDLYPTSPWSENARRLMDNTGTR